MKKLLILLLALGLCATASACAFFQTDSSENSNNTETSSSAMEGFIKVTFRQTGCQDIVKTVKAGETLTDIPVPVAKTGYIVEWDKKEFINVVENMVVTAIETAKTYTITLTTAEGEFSQTTMTVTYGQAYELPIPAHNNKDFIAWKYNGVEVAVKGVWNIDSAQETITLVVQWSEDRWTGFF